MPLAIRQHETPFGVMAAFASSPPHALSIIFGAPVKVVYRFRHVLLVLTWLNETQRYFGLVSPTQEQPVVNTGPTTY
jgi:hypothetical protein